MLITDLICELNLLCLQAISLPIIIPAGQSAVIANNKMKHFLISQHVVLS